MKKLLFFGTCLAVLFTVLTRRVRGLVLQFDFSAAMAVCLIVLGLSIILVSTAIRQTLAVAARNRTGDYDPTSQ
jgi:tetrahydromethanopterin S-methyltransferase subunit E